MVNNRETIKNDVPELWRQRYKAGLCPVCGKTKEQFKKRMRVFCSPKHRDEYAKCFTYWESIKNKIMKRDGERCTICGNTYDSNDTKREELKKQLRLQWAAIPENKKRIDEIRDLKILEWEKEFDERIQKILNDDWCVDHWYWELTGNSESELYKNKLPPRIQLEVDHIKAIVNDGDMWDESNLRVLCSECHKKKTAKDLKERKRLKNKNTKLKIQG